MNKLNGGLKAICGLAGLLLLSACGTGSAVDRAASVVEGLEIANQISLVEAQAVTTSPSVSARSGLAALMKKAITSDESTPYYTDPLDVWVFDESMDALSIINEILCSFDQTRYIDLVNKGTYIALIDLDACSKSADHSSSQNDQSDSENTTTFETWIIDSVRLTNDDPQEVSAWILQEGDGFMPALTIEAKMTITEGKSDTKPYGAFHMDFKMVDPALPDPPIAQGYLETVDRSDEQIEFQFSMKGGDQFPVSENAHVVTSVDGTTGYANTSFEMSFGGETQQGSFNVAFDEDHYYSVDSASEEESCLNRQDFQNYVFRYGVYNEDGSRLEVSNSGFGIKYNGDYGWAGYYGIWLPDDVEVVSELTLERASNDDSSGETYTTIVAPGKLTKHTKETTTLGKIKGATMNYWDNASMKTTRVEWDGTNLVIDAVQACPENLPCTWEEITERNLTAQPGEWLNFWRDGIGNVSFEYPSTALSDSTTLTFDATQVVTGQETEFSGGSVNLYCYQDCLKPGLDSDSLFLSGDPRAFFFDDVTDVTTPYQYVFNPTTMLLTFQGTSIKVEEGNSPMPGSNQWGVQSGSMLTSTSGIEDTSEVWGQSVSYTWETGINDWNHFMGLLDSDGNAVVFSPPTRLDYTHTDGVLYALEYAGFGELQGIPWTQVEGTDRWYPQLTIEDGSTATDDDGATFYIRALEMEQRMTENDDTSPCTDLEFQTLTTPAEDYTDPGVGSMPEVTADPAVIDGELTGS